MGIWGVIKKKVGAENATKMLNNVGVEPDLLRSRTQRAKDRRS